MWISPKPMVDGFVKIFDEFRNGCDEKKRDVSATVTGKFVTLGQIYFTGRTQLANLSILMPAD